MTSRIASAVLAATALLPVPALAQVVKCLIDGSVTYQNTPCPASGSRTPPSAEQFNAERQKRLALARATAASASAPQPASRAAPTLPAQPEALAHASGKTASPGSGHRCDGRTRCAQMTSCAEARYFLAQCPGVALDGDHNGIPCERQWCSR
jgi:hypothetical protein